jgi:hypothetical protein
MLAVVISLWSCLAAPRGGGYDLGKRRQSSTAKLDARILGIYLPR